MSATTTVHDVVIVGGGHNSLVAATYLARAGLTVVVLERLAHVGGAAVSAQAFENFDAHLSRYSYLVSLMPEELISDLGLGLSLRDRAVASYTPYPGGGLMIEANPGPTTAASFRQRTGSDRDFDAWTEFYGEVDSLAQTIWPTLLSPLPSASEIRQSVEPQVWTDLIEQPLGTAIRRRFADDLVRGIVATDALIGTFASVDDPGLTQNRCFLYHVLGGPWRVPVGGMASVTRELERVARAAGVEIVTSAVVDTIDLDADGATAQVGDRTWRGSWLLGGIAPYSLARLCGSEAPVKPSGSQLKINLLLSRLPRLASGDDPNRAFAGTFHINEALSDLENAYAEAINGQVPSIGEVYCHTLTDRSILGAELDAAGAHTLTYFGLHARAENLPDDVSTQRAFEGFITALQEHLAEPLRPLILGAEVKSPLDIEAELAMPGGHIFHGDLSWPWLGDDEHAPTPAHRWGVATDHPRVLICGSGARRGGAVSGIAGHNAAHAILDFIGG